MSCPGDLAGAERIAPNRVLPCCSSWSCQHSLGGGLSRMATVYPYWQTGEHTHYSMGHHIHMSLRPYYFVTEGPGYSLKSVQYTVMDGGQDEFPSPQYNHFDSLGEIRRLITTTIYTPTSIQSTRRQRDKDGGTVMKTPTSRRGGLSTDWRLSLGYYWTNSIVWTEGSHLFICTELN